MPSRGALDDRGASCAICHASVVTRHVRNEIMAARVTTDDHLLVRYPFIHFELNFKKKRLEKYSIDSRVRLRPSCLVSRRIDRTRL